MSQDPHSTGEVPPFRMRADKFKESLQAALNNYHDETAPDARHYQKVIALLVYWESDYERKSENNPSISITNSVDRLGNIFQNLYGYSVMKVGLRQYGHGKSGDGIIESLRQVLKGLDENNLVIFYYVGEGRHFNRDLYFQTPDQGNSVNFSALRRHLIDDARPDVLMLLDCRYGLERDTCPQFGVKEIIQASPHTRGLRGRAAYQDGTDRTFSSHLMQQLTEAAASQEILTTSQLYARLAARALTFNPGTKLTDLRCLPVHTHRHHHDPEQRRRQGLHLPLMLPVLVDRLKRSESYTIAAQSATVILAVHLYDAGEGTLGDMQRWLRKESRPRDADQRVRFIEAYPTLDSVTLLFETTLDVWDYLLREKPQALQFISFKCQPYRSPYRTLHQPESAAEAQQQSEASPFAKDADKDGISPFDKPQKDDDTLPGEDDTPREA
ncbi:hypothetical protein QBC46DRAFT_438381 [Diplogelasinospora grovesii]|uniref:Caspase domain-containing protein n=1 Tax=Diplogelasinospora grovesii TaxID=303347 RepID=A0AAN6S3K9_9PEZI|nr:hypothetical protein QBC46DRAFT_438381 [Diplogelasinospora grovesii]